MQLSDNSLAIAITTTVRRAYTPRIVWLPLALIALVAIAAHLYQVATRTAAADRRLGNMTRREAESLACRLCARLTGEPVKVISTAGYEIGRDDRQKELPSLHEWQISCHTAGNPRDRYSIHINADNAEVILVRHDQEGASASENGSNGDLRGRISYGEAISYARHYLALSGLKPSRNARQLGTYEYEFLWVCDGPNGSKRTLRVHINPMNGRLEHLWNTVYRRYAAADPSLQKRGGDIGKISMASSPCPRTGAGSK
jgi:hypothetical protein